VLGECLVRHSVQLTGVGVPLDSFDPAKVSSLKQAGNSIVTQPDRVQTGERNSLGKKISERLKKGVVNAESNEDATSDFAFVRRKGANI